MSADCTAMRAVSTSRISPTRMMSGSWRRIALSPPANVMSACSLIWIWLIDGNTYSTGSSMVMMLRSELLISLSAAYSVVVLPLPVGPAQMTMPNGERISCENRARVSAGMPSRGSWSSERLLSRSRSTAFSPQMVAVVATRTSRERSSTVASNWPSWERRRSTMFMSARILMRLTIDCAIDAGRFTTSCSAPSTRKRMRSCVVLRLDVDVGRVLAHGLGEDALERLHDRRLLVDEHGPDPDIAHVGDARACTWRRRDRAPSARRRNDRSHDRCRWAMPARA